MKEICNKPIEEYLLINKIFSSVFEVTKKYETEFISEHSFSKRKILHRFLYENMLVDIIRFGDIAENYKISWHLNKDIQMNVIGYEEALTASIIYKLRDNSFKVSCLNDS